MYIFQERYSTYSLNNMLYDEFGKYAFESRLACLEEYKRPGKNVYDTPYYIREELQSYLNVLGTVKEYQYLREQTINNFSKICKFSGENSWIQ